MKCAFARPPRRIMPRCRSFGCRGTCHRPVARIHADRAAHHRPESGGSRRSNGRAQRSRGDRATHLNVLLPCLEPSSMVEVRVASKACRGKQLGQRVSLAQGINLQCLLPIGQELQADALVFFSNSFAFSTVSVPAAAARLHGAASRVEVSAAVSPRLREGLWGASSKQEPLT